MKFLMSLKKAEWVDRGEHKKNGGHLQRSPKNNGGGVITRGPGGVKTFKKKLISSVTANRKIAQSEKKRK